MSGGIISSQSIFDPAANGWEIKAGKHFPATIGQVWQRQIDDLPAIGFLCEESHDNGNGAMHGGILATLADIGVGTAVGQFRNSTNEPDAPHVLSVTIQLNIGFAGSVSIGSFVESRACIDRSTRTLTFASGKLFVGEDVVAVMQGIFKVVRAREGSKGY